MQWICTQTCRYFCSIFFLTKSTYKVLRTSTDPLFNFNEKWTRLYLQALLHRFREQTLWTNTFMLTQAIATAVPASRRRLRRITEKLALVLPTKWSNKLQHHRASAHHFVSNSTCKLNSSITKATMNKQTTPVSDADGPRIAAQLSQHSIRDFIHQPIDSIGASYC